MANLIDRQAAIDAIRASTSKYTGFMEMEMYTDDDAVEAIEGVPPADPEIIRCKDCKHYQFADHKAFGMPVKMCKWFEFEDMDDNDFCSFAERRTDE